MANEEVRNARLALLQAQTEQIRVDTERMAWDLAHKQVNDKQRIYNFPSVIIAETIDTCIEVTNHWLTLDYGAEITIAFNSPGGIVFDGLALYDFVADHVANGAKIDMTGYGKVASMAGVCLQAGRVRSLHRNARFMIHEVETFLQGTNQALKDQLAFTNQLAESLEKILVSRANPEKITVEELHTRTMHKDWWMTAEEALDYGFIDQIA
jgi:ATP-dependent protease ClpP protease subunit